MNILTGKSNVDIVINRILRDIKRIFGSNLTTEKSYYFSFFLEDILVSRAASSYNEVINIFDDKMVNELNAVLLASGITANETMPEGYFSRKLYMVNDDDTYVFVKDFIKQKYILLESGILANTNVPEPTTIDIISNYAVSLMSNLVEFGIGCNEINSGYLDVGSDSYVCIGIQYANYLKAMDFYERYGLNDSLACDICHSIYNPETTPNHYSEIVKLALKLMAKADMMIHVRGPGAVLTGTFIEDTLRTIEAAKLLDSELIEPFSKRFNEIIAPIIDGTSIHTYTNEENRKRFCRVGNIVNFNLIKPENKID